LKLRAAHEAPFVPHDAHAMNPIDGLCHVPLCATDASRSERNIAAWREYLPNECVRTMIRMGWDYTT